MQTCLHSRSCRRESPDPSRAGTRRLQGPSCFWRSSRRSRSRWAPLRERERGSSWLDFQSKRGSQQLPGHSRTSGKYFPDWPCLGRLMAVCLPGTVAACRRQPLSTCGWLPPSSRELPSLVLMLRSFLEEVFFFSRTLRTAGTHGCSRASGCQRPLCFWSGSRWVICSREGPL